MPILCWRGRKTLHKPIQSNPGAAGPSMHVTLECTENTHLHFLPYILEQCVDLYKNKPEE